MSSSIRSLTADDDRPLAAAIVRTIHRPVSAGEATRRLARAIGALGENDEQAQRLFAVLRELHEGFELARSLGRDLWDFAVELEQFQRRGVRSNDLRWLVFKGWICHGHETTTRTAGERCFSSGGPHRLDATSCFVLSQSGADLFAEQSTTNVEARRRLSRLLRSRSCPAGIVNGRSCGWLNISSNASRCRPKRSARSWPRLKRRIGRSESTTRSRASRARPQAPPAQRDQCLESQSGSPADPFSGGWPGTGRVLGIQIRLAHAPEARLGRPRRIAGISRSQPDGAAG